MQQLWLALLWILYCVLHSLMASVPFRKKMELLLGSHYRYYRFFYVLFSFVGMIALIGYQLMVPSPLLFSSGKWIQLCGYFLTISGALLMTLCIKKYFISMSGLRSLLHEKEEGILMVSGIHRYVRHPLYLGTFCFIWGLFLLKPVLSFFITNLIITIYTLIGMRLEEKKLVSVFGEAYENYRKKVGALVPRMRNER
jgi:protein-S-isoprenylcysteine O-methyltransferase Ste14